MMASGSAVQTKGLGAFVCLREKAVYGRLKIGYRTSRVRKKVARVEGRGVIRRMVE